MALPGVDQIAEAVFIRSPIELSFTQLLTVKRNSIILYSILRVSVACSANFKGIGRLGSLTKHMFW